HGCREGARARAGGELMAPRIALEDAMPTTAVAPYEDRVAPFRCHCCGEDRIDCLVLLDSRDLIAGTDNHDPDCFLCTTCHFLEYLSEPSWRDDRRGGLVVHL